MLPHHRGEALASISFVAHLTVMTMTAGQVHGWRVAYCDGELLELGRLLLLLLPVPPLTPSAACLALRLHPPRILLTCCWSMLLPLPLHTQG